MGDVRQGDRKLDVMRPYLDAAEPAGQPGVVAIGETREFQRVFDATAKTTAGGVLARVRAAWQHVTRHIDSTIAAAWPGRPA